MRREYSNTEISRLIDEWIHNELHRDILKSRLIDGLTYEELSARYDVSVRHIKTIVYKNQDMLFRRLD